MTERNCDSECTAFTENARHFNAAAVQLHQVLNKSKPDPGALIRSSSCSFDAVKTLENVRHFRLENADSGIGDRKDHSTIAQFQSDANRTLERELESIREQVQHNL